MREDLPDPSQLDRESIYRAAAYNIMWARVELQKQYGRSLTDEEQAQVTQGVLIKMFGNDTSEIRETVLRYFKELRDAGVFGGSGSE